jgi:hypothetical protein
MIDELINYNDYSEEEARIQAHLDQSAWQSEARFHIVIFSNFLTSVKRVQDLAEELRHVFRNLKPRGLVIVVGGTGGKYPLVYEAVDRIASSAKVHRVRGLPERVRCKYDNAEAIAVKQLYTSVCGRLRQVVPTVAPVAAGKSMRDVWDPDAPLRGPRAFGIRVYRAQNRPPGVRFSTT